MAKPARKRHGQGKPTPPDRFAEALQYVTEGDSILVACSVAGITRQTLHNWASKSPENAEAFARAKARHAQMRLRRLLASGGRDWKSDAWWLKCNYPEEYGDQQKVAVEHSGEVKQKLDISKLSVEELSTLRDVLKKAGAK